MVFAIFGKSSPTCKPVTLLGMPLYFPRISSLASGFRSNESWCDKPPPKYTRMTDFARVRLFGSAEASFSEASRPPSDKPSGESAPTRMKSRRDQPLQNRLLLEFSEMSIILVIKRKFLRVQQRPKEVGINFLAGTACAQSLLERGLFICGWGPRQCCHENLLGGANVILLL